MGSPEFLLLLGGLLFLAFAAEGLFARLRLPPVVVLVLAGLILGPVAHVLPAGRFLAVAPHFGALAFLLILFEGGLDLDLTAVLTRFRAGLVLACAGFLVAVVLVAAAALASGLPAAQAVPLAIALAPVSGSIILPLVGQLGLRPEVRTVLVLEAAFADVLAVLGMKVLATLLTGGGVAGLLALGSLLAALFSVAVAVLTGLIWPRVMRRLGSRRYLDSLTLGVAMVMWGVADLLGASGALVVLVFGVTLANERRLLGLVGLPGGADAELAAETVRGLHRFIGQLTFVVRAFFFVFLGVVVSFAQLPLVYYALALAVVALLLLGRRLTLGGVAPRSGCMLEPEERLPLVLLQPRGLVSAVLAIEAAHLGLGDGELLLGVVSLVILATNLLLIPAALRLPPAPGEASSVGITGIRPR